MAIFLVQLAYIANILILTPVLISLFTDSGNVRLKVFEGTIHNVDGLRLLVASLWLGILILSLIGIFIPLTILPILALQVIYKSCYLLTYIFPKWMAGENANIPKALTICFIMIVLIWPFIIYIN
jgi:hypothetical protein